MSAIALVHALAVAFVAPVAKPGSIAAVAKPATPSVAPKMYMYGSMAANMYASPFSSVAGMTRGYNYYGPYSGAYGGYAGIGGGYGRGMYGGYGYGTGTATVDQYDGWGSKGYTRAYGMGGMYGGYGRGMYGGYGMGRYGGMGGYGGCKSQGPNPRALATVLP